MRLSTRLGIVGTLAMATVAGCTTTRFQPDRFTISESRRDAIFEAATQPVKVEYAEGVQSDSYATTLAESHRYGILPDFRFTLNVSDNQGLHQRIVDTTGPQNAAYSAARKIEDSVGNNQNRTRFIMGAPDSAEHLSPYSDDNQLTTHSGLLAVEIFTQEGQKPGFTVKVNQENTFGNNLRERKGYSIVIKPADKTELSKVKTNYVFPIKVVGDSAVGYAVFQEPGAVGAAAMNFFDGIWGYFEGSDAPKGANITRGTVTISNLEMTATNTVSSLKFAKELGATEMTVVPFNIGEIRGEEIIYSRGAVVGVDKDGTATLLTDEQGANYIGDLLYGAGRDAAGFGSAEITRRSIINHHPRKHDNDRDHNPNPQPAITGGREAVGPGGNGHSSTSGNSGTSGTTGTGGRGGGGN